MRVPVVVSDENDRTLGRCGQRWQGRHEPLIHIREEQVCLEYNYILTSTNSSHYSLAATFLYFLLTTRILLVQWNLDWMNLDKTTGSLRQFCSNPLEMSITLNVKNTLFFWASQEDLLSMNILGKKPLQDKFPTLPTSILRILVNKRWLRCLSRHAASYFQSPHSSPHSYPVAVR